MPVKKKGSPEKIKIVERPKEKEVKVETPKEDLEQDMYVEE